MATKTVSLRIDEPLYEQFVDFCNRIYIPASALFAAFAAKTVREQRIPFEVSLDPFYSPSNTEHLLHAIDQLESGDGVAHDLIEV